MGTQSSSEPPFRVSPDGTVQDNTFLGRERARIQGGRLHAPDGLIFAGQEWGYIDEEGNIRLSRGIFTHRIIGQVRGDPARSFLYYLQQYDIVADRVSALEREVAAAEHKVNLERAVRTQLERLQTANILGDIDALDRRLKDLLKVIETQVEERRRRKHRLVDEAESLSRTDDWKSAAERFTLLRAELKAIGYCGESVDQPIWFNFTHHSNEFYRRRKEHFARLADEWARAAAAKVELCKQAEYWADHRDLAEAGAHIRELSVTWKATGYSGREAEPTLKERFYTATSRFYARREATATEARKRKEHLVSRAESLAYSTDWKVAGDEFKALSAEWKQAGYAGKDHDGALWEQFRASQSRFYEARSRFWAERNAQAAENLTAKEALCRQMEALDGSQGRTATDQAKQLQQQWKLLGPVPKEQSQMLWARFRAATDAVYAAAKEASRDRSRAFIDNLYSKNEDLRERIAKAEENISRWESQMWNLSGPRADEWRAQKQGRIDSAKNRIRDMHDWIDNNTDKIRSAESRL